MLTVKKAWQQDEVFVQKIRGGKRGKKVWEILEYCREERKYCLRSVDDISDSIYLHGDTVVLIANY